MIVHNVAQNTEEWHHLRKGKITGTVLKSIMGTPKARKEAVYQIVGERLRTGTDSQHENPMDRGNRLEPDAIAAFEFATGLKTKKVGFASHEDSEFMGQSPDRYVCDTDDTEAVEAKCPLEKNYVKMWLTNAVPDEYEEQVTQYFVVNDALQKLHFIGYNPEIPVHPLHIITVTRESLGTRIEEAREAQKAFLAEVEAILSTIIKI